jgi:hypothetical protein
VIEAAARMAEALLPASPHTRIMTSSREPLRSPADLRTARVLLETLQAG